MYHDSQSLLSDLRSKDCIFWSDLGKKKAIDLFHKAAEKVPAYRDVLEKTGIKDHTKIETFVEFEKNVPVLDKENYIYNYSLEDRCYEGNLSGGSVLAQSSGTVSGVSCVWPRFFESDKNSVLLHETLFGTFFKYYDKSTLFIVCFHLGSHVAGFITSTSIQQMIYASGHGSMMTPGLDRKSILTALRDISPHFEQTILIGYPPFIKDIVQEAQGDGVDVHALNIQMIFSAESFPEDWRKKLHSILGEDIQNNRSINIYGSADIGFMGHETSMTVGLRSFLSSPQGESLANKMGINPYFVPGIYQFHPWNILFESIDGELVCTSGAGIPLIRYNIKDSGRVHTFDEIFEFCKTIHDPIMWQLPLVTVFGRSNYSVTIYGVNIYPEHIREIMADEYCSEFLSGKFFLKTIFQNMDQYFEIHVELKRGIHMDIDLQENFQKHFFSEIKKINSEYYKLSNAVGNKVSPIIVLHDNKSKEFELLKTKHKYIVKN